MKYLMRDYIYGWHWENFKASYEHGNSAIFNFLAVQLIFVAQIIKTAGWAQLVIASGYFISLAICCLSIFTHPAELRTMYYVCPLTTNEREKLVRNSYIFRVAVHMLILTIGNIYDDGSKIQCVCIYIYYYKCIYNQHAASIWQKRWIVIICYGTYNYMYNY